MSVTREFISIHMHILRYPFTKALSQITARAMTSTLIVDVTIERHDSLLLSLLSHFVYFLIRL